MHEACDPAIATLGADATVQEISETFAAHGFVVLRGFLSGETLAEVQREASRAATELPGKIPPEHVMFDDAEHASTLKQIQQLWRHDDYFGALMRRLQATAEAALGEACTAQNMQWFNKPARSAYASSSCCCGSRPTPPHQDGHYFMLSPPTAGCTMWLALDAADETNGCLRYVMGSAAASAPRAHGFSGVLGFSQELSDFGAADEAREVAMRAEPGDLLVHSALLIHRADANASAERPRRALGAIFYTASAVVDQEAYAARQLEIRRRAAVLPGQNLASVGLQEGAASDAVSVETS